MATINVRYMVHDVDAAVRFYTTHFGFTLLSNAAPAFADVVRVKRVHMAGVAVPFEVVLTRVASR